jgi:transposase InsO family protein
MEPIVQPNFMATAGTPAWTKLYWSVRTEFVAHVLRKWLASTGAQTLYIEPGSPWENGFCESFNSKLRDEFLNGEIFYSVREIRVLAERWRVHYNTVRPHSSLGYRPPAPEAWIATNLGSGQANWIRRLPPEMITAHLHLDASAIARIPSEKLGIL